MSEEQGKEQVKHHLGKYMGRGEEELGRQRTGNPDLMGESAAAEPERTAEFVEQQRPHFTTSVDQRDLDTDRDPETEGMAVKEDAAPGADAQGG